MDSRKIDKCLKIIDRLFKLPCAQLFITPLRELLGEDDYRDYLKRVKSGRAVDLLTIRRNLDKRKYRSVEEFETDVRLIKKNCADYNGTKASITLLAQYMIEHYESIKREYFIGRADTLITRCSKLFLKLDNLLAAHPKGVPALEAFDSFSSEITKTKQNSLLKLKESLDSLLSKDQGLAMPLLFLLKESEPMYQNGQNNLQVDLKQLQPETITRLAKFIADSTQNC